MTEARITLDAAALEELRGRTFLPGPVTTDRLVQQSAAALDLQDRVATLEATCRKLELDAAEAMALVLDGEGKIATLEAELAASRLDADLAWAEAKLIGEDEDAANLNAANWQAHAKTLREALEQLRGPCEYQKPCVRGTAHPCRSCEDAWFINDALLATPAASLAAHDAEVLERERARVRASVDLATRAYRGSHHSSSSTYNLTLIMADVCRALAAQEVKP